MIEYSYLLIRLEIGEISVLFVIYLIKEVQTKKTLRIFAEIMPAGRSANSQLIVNFPCFSEGEIF